MEQQIIFSISLLRALCCHISLRVGHLERQIYAGPIGTSHGWYSMSSRSEQNSRSNEPATTPGHRHGCISRKDIRHCRTDGGPVRTAVPSRSETHGRLRQSTQAARQRWKMCGGRRVGLHHRWLSYAGNGTGTILKRGGTMFGISHDVLMLILVGMLVGGSWHISRQLDKIIDLLGSILLK